MHIKFAPFINHDVKLESVAPIGLDGEVVALGTINGKRAALTLSTAEALLFFRELKRMNIEGMAKVHGGG